MERKGRFVIIELPDGRIIKRIPTVKSIGNFQQLYVRYKGKIYAIGNGDEYVRGMPDRFRLKYLCSINGSKYILYSEHKEEMEKDPSKKIYFENYIEFPD